MPFENVSCYALGQTKSRRDLKVDVSQASVPQLEAPSFSSAAAAALLCTTHTVFSSIEVDNKEGVTL